MFRVRGQDPSMNCELSVSYIGWWVLWPSCCSMLENIAGELQAQHRRKEKIQVLLAHCNEWSRRWASYKMLMTWSRQKHRKEKQSLCGLFVFLQEFSAASLMVFPLPPQRSEAKTLATQNCTLFFAIQLFARFINAWRKETVILRKTRFSTCVVRCMKKKQISQAKVVASASNRNSYFCVRETHRCLDLNSKTEARKVKAKCAGREAGKMICWIYSSSGCL